MKDWLGGETFIADWGRLWRTIDRRSRSATMQTKIARGRRTIIEVPVECERHLGRLTPYGFRLAQTPTAQEKRLGKSNEDRRLVRGRLARIDDQYRLEGCP